MMREERFVLDAWTSEGFNQELALRRPTANMMLVAGMLHQISKVVMISVTTME